MMLFYLQIVEMRTGMLSTLVVVLTLIWCAKRAVTGLMGALSVPQTLRKSDARLRQFLTKSQYVKRGFFHFF